MCISTRHFGWKSRSTDSSVHGAGHEACPCGTGGHLADRAAAISQPSTAATDVRAAALSIENWALADDAANYVATQGTGSPIQ